MGAVYINQLDTGTALSLDATLQQGSLTRMATVTRFLSNGIQINPSRGFRQLY